jgi:hypothetical protein
MFKKIYQNKLNTWDLQLLYAILKNNGLCIIPNENLVENIGFTGSGTHTAYDEFGFIKKMAVGEIYHKLTANAKKKTEFPLVHPEFMLPEYEADRRYFKNIVYHFFMRLYLVFLRHFR